MATKNKCAYCGNNPVDHLPNWYFESINVLMTPLRQAVMFNPVSGLVKKIINSLRLSERLVYAGLRLGILSVNTDRSLCKSPRALVLWEDAQRRGIKLSELLLFGRPLDSYIAEKNANGKIRRILFTGLPRPRELENPAVLDVMDDKTFFKKTLLAADLPAPAGGTAGSFRAAEKIFSRIKKPVIVKPRSGSRGRHSTTFIYTVDDLRKAVAVAKQLCHWVVVEEHLFGSVYRATVINYELCGVLRGDSPFVTGDGIRSINELVEIKNALPHQGVKNILLDERARIFLQRQGLNFSSIVPSGQTASLSEKIGVNYGGSSSEDFEICHPETKELFVRAARALGDPIVGFDFIISDITKSYKEQNCGFIEANSLPFINLHHDPLLGQPRNVAQYVWKLVGM